MSLERHSYLYVAFAMMILIFLEEWFLQVLFSICLWGGYCYLYKQGKYICIILFIGIILLSNQEAAFAKHTVVKIDEIKDSYVIASSGKEKSILYNVEGVSLGDVIQVKGKFERIHSTNNLHMYRFDQDCKRKGILSSMYVQSFETIKKANHLKARLYRKVQSIDNKKIKQILNQILYRIDDQNEKIPLIYASGMHLSFCIAILSKVLKCSYSHLAIGISLLYFVIFPVHFFVVRIFITTLVNIGFKTFHLRERIGISMIVMMFYDVHCIYQISFIVPLLFQVAFAFNLTKIPKMILQILIILPIQLFFFHHCKIIELLCFSLLRKLAGITFLCALLSLCFPCLYEILIALYEMQVFVHEFISSTYALIGRPYFFWMLLWYTLVIGLLTKVKKQYIFYIVCLLLWQFHLKVWNPSGEISFIDVGQGDCIFIREPFDGEVLLIDVAGKMNHDLAAEIIYPYLQMKGIKKIDKIVITHDDYDHNGGLKSLQKLIPVNKVIKEAKDVKLKNMTLYSLNETKKLADKNDNSVVLFTKVNHLTYLFMGDAPKEREKQIVEMYNRLQADVLKVGHHGSKTSSDQDFITQIHPLLSVISSGYKNRYNHPDLEVLDILKQAGSKIVNTQINGSISIFHIADFNFLLMADGSIAVL